MKRFSQPKFHVRDNKVLICLLISYSYNMMRDIANMNYLCVLYYTAIETDNAEIRYKFSSSSVEKSPF